MNILYTRNMDVSLAEVEDVSMRLSPKEFALLLVALVLGACTPAAGSQRGFAYIWYVAPSGDNASSCDEPTRPCRTLEGALAKARSTNTRIETEYSGETVTIFHTINVAAGTYNEISRLEGYPFAYGDINVTVVGEGRTRTIFDAANLYGGFYINGNVRVALRNLTIRNVAGSAPDSCVNIRGAAEVTLENVTLRRCVRNGISHTSTGRLSLINVTATQALDDGFGNGVGVASAGELNVQGGSFSGNEGSGIRSSGTLVAENASITNNRRDGLITSGEATLTNLNIHNNGLDTSFRSGLHVNGGNALVEDSQITENQLGVQVSSGTLQLTDSVVGENPRTGVHVAGGELLLVGSRVEGNGSFYAGTSLGGGVEIAAAGRAVLRQSQVLGNHNGGILNYGELLLLDSTVRGNFAGLPAISNYAGATATITRSLIADNRLGERAVSGEVTLDNRGSMNVLNTTFSGNEGNGVANAGTMNLSFSTLAFNSGYGFLFSESAAGTVYLTSNLIAGNGNDCYLPTGGDRRPSLSGRNLDTDGSCRFSTTVALDSLQLSELADNGGATLTHALRTGSPAIDASTGSCPANDQRSRARPFGDQCDVGAFEAGSTVVRISDETTDFDPEDFATSTPGLQVLVVIPNQNYNCRKGNSSAFDIADTLKAGQEYIPSGIGVDLLWFQFQGPSYGEPCWAPTAGFTLYLDGVQVELGQLPEGLLAFATYPPTPTVTPLPAAPGNAAATETACTPNGYTVTVTWSDLSDNETGFRIYHNGQLLGTVGANVTQFTHTVPSNWNQQQSYFVEAYNNFGAASSNTATEDGCQP